MNKYFQSLTLEDSQKKVVGNQNQQQQQMEIEQSQPKDKNYVMRTQQSNVQQLMILDSDEEKEEIQSLIQEYGTFETDKAVKIECRVFTNFGIDRDQKKFKADEFWYKVAWKERKNGVTPQKSFWQTDEIRKYSPGLLVDYLINNSILRIFQS